MIVRGFLHVLVCRRCPKEHEQTRHLLCVDRNNGFFSDFCLARLTGSDPWQPVTGCEIWPEERRFELRLVITSVGLKTKTSAPAPGRIAQDGMGQGQEMPCRR